MKRTTKLLALLLAMLMLAAMLTACGGSAAPAENDAEPVNTTEAEAVDTEAPAEPEPAEIGGGEAEWGNYTVLVPEGFELAEGGEFSSYDFSVKKSDFSYFDFNTESDDEVMMNHYNYNKETYTNEQSDVEATYGENAWTGFQYSDGLGGYGFEAYTTLGGKIVRVSCAGFRFDSAEAQAVLASLAAK